MNIALIGNTILRMAIRRNLVSFPSQIPAFVKHGELQERIVQLFFVRGWTVKAICDRYGLGKSTVRKLISDWKIRAVAAGYIQEIHLEALVDLTSEENFGLSDAREVSEPDTDFIAPELQWELALSTRSGPVNSAPPSQ